MGEDEFLHVVMPMHPPRKIDQSHEIREATRNGPPLLFLSHQCYRPSAKARKVGCHASLHGQRPQLHPWGQRIGRGQHIAVIGGEFVKTLHIAIDVKDNRPQRVAILHGTT